jgi:hypothetical protein
MAKNKRKAGQLSLSFGMIFSIILIVIFISFAFFAIKKFLDIQKSVEIGKFVNGFQSDVDRLWQGSQGSELREYSLPKSVELVCFADYSEGAIGVNSAIYQRLYEVYYERENMFFYPLGSGEGIDSKEIRHIDIQRITETDNPYCIKNIQGKMGIAIKKDFGEALVTISG